MDRRRLAGVRWDTTDRKLSAELAAVVEHVAGAGPTRIDGADTLRVFKVAEPFDSRRLPPLYFPKEPHTALSYRPYRVELLCRASWLVVSGGTWRGGALPAVRRDELPTLKRERTDRIVSEIETLIHNKGAMPWR